MHTNFWRRSVPMISSSLFTLAITTLLLFLVAGCDRHESDVNTNLADVSVTQLKIQNSKRTDGLIRVKGYFVKAGPHGGPALYSSLESAQLENTAESVDLLMIAGDPDFGHGCEDGFVVVIAHEIDKEGFVSVRRIGSYSADFELESTCWKSMREWETEKK